MIFRNRLCLVLLLMLATAGSQLLTAQTVELFGGYTATKMKPENSSHLAFNGWSSSITGYPTKRFGLTADFAGVYGSVAPSLSTSTGATTNMPSVNVRQYSFLAGPQIRLLTREKFSTSFRALVGAASGYVSNPPTVPNGMSYDSLSQTKFASLIGTNFDYNISKKFAIRFSPGLYITQFGGETQRNFRFSVGPVFKFGGDR